MRKWLLVLLMLALMLPSAARAEEAVSLTAISVGKGDALLLQVGAQRYLIDTGRPWAWGRLASALDELGVEALDGVILTHTDKDHAGGLLPLAQSDVQVSAWYAAALYADPKKQEKHPMVVAAALRGQQVQFLGAGDEIPCDAGTIAVLAPLALDAEVENNNSLVLHVQTAQGALLLTGDMEFGEEAQLLATGRSLAADVLKVPHHGEDDATGASLLRAVSPSLAVICTDTEEEPDTPDPVVLAMLEQAGADVVVTQDAEMAVRVTLQDGQAKAELLGYGAQLPALADVGLDVSAQPEIIRLENRGVEALDLSGWYLYTDRGEDLYLFPEDTTIALGAMLSVSTRESEAAGDLHWDVKNAVSNKKDDVVYLYDAYGRCVNSAETYGAK